MKYSAWENYTTDGEWWVKRWGFNNLGEWGRFYAAFQKYLLCSKNPPNPLIILRNYR
jgi:hypothetical protein